MIEWEPAVVVLSVDLSASVRLFEHLRFAKKHWESTIQPDGQPVRQEVIQQRSEGAAWDDLCFAQECWMSLGYTALNGCCLLSHIRMLFMVKVKMLHYCPFINFVLNVQLIKRQTEKEMNHCSAPVRISRQSFDCFRTETDSWATCWQLVAKQKWKTLICITAPRNYSKQKFLRVTSTSDMTLSACASLRGPCASVSIQHTAHMNFKSFRHQEATVISCPFLSLFKTAQSAAF